MSDNPLTVTMVPDVVTLIWSLPLDPLTVTVSAARRQWPLPAEARSMLTCVTSVLVRSLTTMLSAPPRACEPIVSTLSRSIVMLATSRVNSAREPLVEMLMFSLTLAPLKCKGVDAVLPLDDVAAVARVPDEHIVASAEDCGVAPAPARDDVIAVAADQRVVPVAAGDRVIARAAVDGELDQGGEAVPGGDHVVAAVGVDYQVLGGADIEENGAGLTRSKRTRSPLAVIVNTSAPLPPLTSAVSVPSPPSIRSLSSPGFQIMRSSPACPNIWSSPSPPVNTSLPPPPKSISAPPLPRSVSLPAWPKSRSFPEPPVSTSLPGPPNS